jgi:hypothetical protein
MKKTFLFILLLMTLSFALKDTVKSSGKWSTLTWSTGSAPTTSDTVYRISGSYNDTMDADYTIKAFVSGSLAIGYHARTGHVLTITGTGTPYSDVYKSYINISPTNYGNGLTLTSERSTIEFSDPNDYATGKSNCTFSLVNRDTIRELPGSSSESIWKALSLGDADSVYIDVNSYIFKSDIPLICGNNCFIKGSTFLAFLKTTSGSFVSGTSSIALSGRQVAFFPSTSGISCSTPALDVNGTLLLTAFCASSNLTSVICNGNITATEIDLGNLPGDNCYQMTDLNGYSVSCTFLCLRVYSSNTLVDSLVFGSGNHTINILIANNGDAAPGSNFYLNLGSCKIHSNNRVVFYPLMKVIPGTSEIFYMNLTTANQPLYSLTAYPVINEHDITGRVSSTGNFSVATGVVKVNNSISRGDTTGYNDTIGSLYLTTSDDHSNHGNTFFNDTLSIINNFLYTSQSMDSTHLYKVRFISTSNHNVTSNLKNLGVFTLLDGGQATLLSRMLCKMWNDSVGTTFTNGYTLRPDSLLVLGDSVRSADSIKCSGDLRVKSGMRSNITGVVQLDSTTLSHLTGAGTDISKSLGKLEFKKLSNGVIQSGAIRSISIGFIDGTFSQTHSTDTVRTDSANILSTDSSTFIAPFIAQKSINLNGAKTRFSSVHASYFNSVSGTFKQNASTDTIVVDSVNIASTDSTIFIAPLVIRKKLNMSIVAKIRFSATSKLITVSGDSLTIIAGGHSLPRIVNRSKVIYR